MAVFFQVYGAILKTIYFSEVNKVKKECHTATNSMGEMAWLLSA
ncbi:MAG: hypothetical protein WCI73_10190 [Phycisphaerae bacterium]